jgi:hypothetical protein
MLTPQANAGPLAPPTSDDYKIYIDGGQPATLNNGAQTDCATLQEAVSVWHRLASE